MYKEQFLSALRRGLSQLPPEEIEKQVAYYSELIDDMTEDGMTEYEAVSRLGSVEDIYQDILQNMPLPLLVKSRAKPKGGWTALSIVLIILGFPIWFSLLAALFAVVIIVYVSLWAVGISVFAAVLVIIVCAVVLAVFFVILLFSNFSAAVLAMGAGFVLAGVALLLGLGAFYLCKGIVKLTAAIGRGIKRLFIRKES